MAVDKTDRSVISLIAEISSGEIKLPEIQRGYVWKPTQVAKLVESLYRQYPSGSLLFWRTDEAPQTRAVAANAPTVAPARLPLYLLDGQQRLTSLHRVFTDHPGAQVVFNVETEKFQNQSAATRKDARWIKVYDLIGPDADPLETQDRLRDLGLEIDSKEIGRRIRRLASIPDYRYHMEIITDLPYDEVTQIFVRVNSGGRPLKTTDLALATLSARWPGVLGKLESEASHWRGRGYGDLDVTFLTRALTGAVLGRGLSVWSHGRLVAATDEELESGWATVARGLRHLVPLLQSNLKVTHSSLLPSVNVLLPLVVLLGERPDEPLDPELANGIVYWFLVATLRNRYSSGADSLLGQDIPAARQDHPVHALLANLGLTGRVEVIEQALAGRGVTSPYFFASFLVAQRHGARDWWYGTEISAGAEGGMKLEHHHVHPQATLKRRYSKAEINDLANLAFISAKANRTISDRSPADYFPTLREDELTAHSVPLTESLRTAEAYRAFLAARRKVLADRMTELLNLYRPSWLDESPAAPSDELAGCSVDLVMYESGWEEGRLLVTARTGDAEWACTLDLPALEAALTDAAAGIAADLPLGEETVPVRVENEDIEIPLGPFVLFGTAPDWRDVLTREREDAQPIAECPTTPNTPWKGQNRTRFPITSSE